MQPIDSPFSVPPFPAFPSVSRYVPLGSIEDALQRVRRSIDAREGIALILGPPGTGKSLACNVLADAYRETHDVVVLGETPIADGNAFRRHVLHHLEVELNKTPSDDFQLALTDYICDPDSPSGGLLILIDEAQSLAAEVIESIRMVTNIMRSGQPRVFAVLCGNASLEETLVSSSMEAFSQRVATRCYLHPMNSEETRAYIGETIRRCDADPETTITPEAIAAVHHACVGVPRLINQIMTEAIDCAAESDTMLIDESIIDRAWARLQQLPSPMIEEPKLTGGAPVEFGELLLDDVEEDVEEVGASDLEIQPTNPRDRCEIEPRERLAEDIEEAETASMNGNKTVAADAPVWIETPADAHLCSEPPTLSPSDLFGDFESEEDVTIGHQRVPGPVSVGLADGPVGSGPVGYGPVGNEVESVLHQEIIGMSAIAAESLRAYEPSGEPNEPPASAAIEPAIDAAEDFECQPTGGEAATEEPDASIPGTEGESAATYPLSNLSNWSTKLDLPEADDRVPVQEGDLAQDDDLVQQDDIDLLVIEDEVQLTRVDEHKRVDAREQTISVDFQAMLTRMRSNA